MIDLDQWQEANNNYLSAAIAWLSLRLKQLATEGPSDMHPVGLRPMEQSATGLHPTGLHDRPQLQVEAEQLAPASNPVESSPGRPAPWAFWRRGPSNALPGPAKDVPLLSGKNGIHSSPESSITEQIDQANAALQAAAQIQPPPALVILSYQLGLSAFEQSVLLLCTAMELDTRIASLCGRAQGDLSRPFPTFALALSAFDNPAWEALSPERPLRRWRLVEINPRGPEPLTTSPLRADERIVNYIKGLNYLDDRLAPLFVPMEAAPSLGSELPSSQQALVDAILRIWKAPARSDPPTLIQLVGPDSYSQQLAARHAVQALGLALYRLPAELLPAHASDLETFIRLWQRENALMPVALYLDAHPLESSAGDGQAVSLNRFLADRPGMTFLAAREIWPGLNLPSAVLDVSRPTPAEQQDEWGEALGKKAGASPGLLASQFNLNLAAIHRIAGQVLAEEDDRADLTDRLWKGCLDETHPRLDVLAQRLLPKATWDDIVLPAPELALLHQVAGQVGQRGKVYDQWGFREKMNRGLGINALFAGVSGTGKTMAAEVLASDLRLNLFRIDLSAVVSKYIGETEKNLRRLFDAAEDGGAILFFDEADALFGKRSEVKDSHDRYANIEINYLLQRMEAFRGLAILATNMKSALDPAFLRRLRFIVNFPFPGPDERLAIWQKVFPAETPLETQNAKEKIDFSRLAHFNLTGGSIHNIAINAAFLAAAAGTHVTRSQLLQAAQTELRKLEKPVNEADFV